MKFDQMHDGRKMLVLANRATHDEFHSIKDSIFNQLNIEAIEYVDDHDELYISFKYDEVLLTLSFGNYTGVVIYAKSSMDRLKSEKALISLAKALSIDSD